MPAAVLVTSLVGATAVLVWRMRETSRPVTAAKIVLPPLGMSTGLSMFVYPPARIPLSWAACAFAAGALLLAHPLLKTSKLTLRGDEVWLQRSRAFLAVLLALVAIRFAARSYIGRYLDVLQTGSVFFLLAFGMIVRWRATMFVQYRALRARAPASGAVEQPPDPQ